MRFRPRFTLRFMLLCVALVAIVLGASAAWQRYRFARDYPFGYLEIVGGENENEFMVRRVQDQPRSERSSRP